jgi:hypothetical protein
MRVIRAAGVWLLLGLLTPHVFIAQQARGDQQTRPSQADGVVRLLSDL